MENGLFRIRIIEAGFIQKWNFIHGKLCDHTFRHENLFFKKISSFCKAGSLKFLGRRGLAEQDAVPHQNSRISAV